MNQPMHDDPEVVRALESSVVLRAVARAGNALWDAAARSRSASRFADARRAWRAQPRDQRRRSTACVLIVAAAIHVILVAVNEVPAGWLWLLPPAMAASIGSVIALMADAPETH